MTLVIAIVYLIIGTGIGWTYFDHKYHHKVEVDKLSFVAGLIGSFWLPILIYIGISRLLRIVSLLNRI